VCIKSSKLPALVMSGVGGDQQRLARLTMSEWQLSEAGPMLGNGGYGEGFRPPAIAGRWSRHEPAYGNRPCTNLRATRNAQCAYGVLRIFEQLR
jgi:hypothetical protein